MSFLAELKRRNVIRVALFYIVSAWLLVQVAETVLPLFEVPDGVLRGFVILLALGFVPALVFAWVFEWTPDGIRLDSEAQQTPGGGSRSSNKLNWATLVVALVAIGFLLLDRTLLQPPSPSVVATAPAPPTVAAGSLAPTAANASIAVLPFADLSPTGDQAYFSDGIAEEILNVLVNVEGLAVASRTSSFQFKQRQNIGIPLIAGELGVRHVLEGSLRKDGESIRVTAQLIDAVSDQQLWSETWDRELTSGNLFAIQDEIATAIVDSIQANLDVEIGDASAVPQRTGNIDAYGLFLDARSKYQGRIDLTDASRQLGQAIELDSEFADAWSLLAAIQAISPQYNYALPNGESDAYAAARRSAQRALDLDANNPLAIGVFGLVEGLEINEGLARHSYSGLIEHFDQALALDPNNLSLLNWRGAALIGAAHFERAGLDFARCSELEPAYAVCRSNLAAVRIAQGRLEEGRQLLFEAAEYGALVRNGTTLVMLAAVGERRVFHFVAAGAPQLAGWHAMDDLYQSLRIPEQSHDALADRFAAFLERSGNTTGDAVNLLIPLGRYEHGPSTNALWMQPFRIYRTSPEFKQLMRDRGIVEYWRETRFPENCRPIVTTSGEDDFECD